MARTLLIAVAAWLVVPAGLPAQALQPRFQWHQGLVLTYRVEQTTQVADTVEGKTSETSSKLNTLKRWEVTAVDAQGVATLQLSLLALRIETKSPRGETLLFDSAQLDKSTPQLKEQMARYVGAPLSVLRVNALGKVVEVKECRFAPASRFESEPPFGVVFADEAANGTWQRSYQVTLEPPQGTGDKFTATQTYTVKNQSPGKLTIGLTTALALPAAAADQVPLLQWLPEGEIIFDAVGGAMESAHLKVDKELKDHQGAGSRYHFQSTYSEEFAGNR